MLMVGDAHPTWLYTDMDEHLKSWAKFLKPETLRENLISISLFISAFEMFKEQVISKPETFYSDGFDQNGSIINEKYKTDVLTKSKSKILASLLWFKEMEAIDQHDIDSFNEIRIHRNEVAHEIMNFISDANKNLDFSIFRKLIDLLSKIEKWWFINFEMGVDPEMLPEGANAKDVIPGPIWSFQVMLDIALGNEPKEGFYYDEFFKKNST